MYSYNQDPRGLRKKKPRWDKLLREYGGIAGAVLLFLCICVIVALNGKAGYWKQLAQEHEGHHHRYKSSHSSLEQALQLKERDLEETHSHRQSAQDQVTELEHKLQAEHRAVASAQVELHTAKREAREAAAKLADTTQQLADAKLDLDTCLNQVKQHGSSSDGHKQELADLRQRLSAHETRELQLLTTKQELEHAVQTLKAQAEAKGVHLDDPAGMAGVVSGGLTSGKLDGLSKPVPSAPAVDAQPLLHSAEVVRQQPEPSAPLVVEHLPVDLIGEAGQGRRKTPQAPDL